MNRVNTYELRGACGAQTIIKITAERYAALAKARHCLIDAGNFERRYELMIANFLAFEEFCAVAHLRNKVRMDWGYESGDAVIMEANRHIINVFTSGKAYTDQVVRDFRSFGSEGTFANQARSLTSAAYDRVLSYRITCQLRDRAQHRALPVDGYDGGKSEIGLYASKDKIRLDRGKFKASILEECPEKIYLLPTLREHTQELSKIHIELRKLVHAFVESSRELISSAIAEFRQQQSSPDGVSRTGIGLEAVHRRHDTVIESFPLLLNWDDNRVRLSQKNKYPIRFSGA